MRALPVLVLLALLAPLPGAAAQGEAGGVRLALEPPSRDTVPGGTVETVLVLANDLPRPVTLALSTTMPDGWNVTLRSWEVRLDPNGVARLPARIVVPGEAPTGPHPVTFRAEERASASTPPGAQPAAASARFAARVLPDNETLHNATQPRQPGIMPSLRVEPRELLVAAGGGAAAKVVLRAGSRPLDNYEIVLEAPAGFTWSLGQRPGFVEAGQQVEFQLLISAPAGLEEGRLVPVGAVLHGDMPVRAPFEVRIAAAAEPEPPAQDGPIRSTGVLVAIAAGGLGVAGAAYVTLRGKWPWLLAPLYTRLKPSRLLDHPLRERFVAIVKESPGITFGELQRRLGVGAGTVTHHARMLEKARIVFSSPDGQQRRFFPIGSGRVDAVPPLPERVLSTLREKGARSAADLARDLGVSRQAVHYHLKQLEATRRVEARQRGREVVYAAVARAVPEA